GYRPAIGAIINRLKSALGGQCLPRQLTPNATGQVQCLIIEASTTGGQCDCPSDKARRPVQPANQEAIKAAKQTTAGQGANWDCFCEITQIGEPELVNQGLTSPE